MGWTLAVPATSQEFEPAVDHQNIVVTRPVREAKFVVIGRRNVVSRQDVRGGAEISGFVVQCATAEEHDELMTAIDSGHVMHLTAPWGDDWYVTCGTVTDVHRADASIGDQPFRMVALPLTEVDGDA